MKNKTILLICISLLILLCISVPIYFLLIKDKETNQEFTLYRESGDVFYKEDSTDYLKLESGYIALQSGSFVKTETGYAHIISEDNSLISIDKNTEIQINIDDNTFSVYQIIGNTWHRLKSLATGKEYTVETSKTVATVRGTIFAIGVNENEVNGFVIESSVDFLLKNQDISKKISEEQYVFTQVSTQQSDLTVATIPDSIQQSAWFKRNLVIDELFNTQDPESFINDLKNNEDLLKIDTGEVEESTDSSSDSTTDNSTEDTTDVSAEAESAINQFFNYIDQGEASKAALMLSTDLVGTEPVQANSVLQQYAVTFSQWDSVSVSFITYSDGSDNIYTYKVEFIIQLSENATGTLYENGTNTRWITVKLENNEWKISSIATGP